MKRVGLLFERVVAFENLLHATRQAARGKKSQLRVAHFLFHQEKECLRLQTELKQGIWQPSGFRVFEIREPKPRRISAADFQDRVVQHALCNILGPLCERRLIFDTWACRRGKGSHLAMKRAQAFSRRFPYFLKCDIRRYFDSVDHTILKRLLWRLIKDKPVLNLLDRIIDHPLPGALPGKGLPIGNLTSQHFANLYLGELDHQLKDRMGVKAYLRYMDDMLIFADDKSRLHELVTGIEDFVKQHLQLSLRPSATLVAPVSEGVPFLGFRIFPGLVRVNGQALRRFRHRLRLHEKAYQTGKMDVESLTASVQSMIAHLQHADTHRLRQSLLSSSCALG
ncbi:RNA-directed DNA polymerase (Reverse transcriptase) (plasmid) [Prosthecochloris aestuarii DSM 271]|uniref:RNA-directed DNA polymerase (Reverse transcriptase) n=1 Tax=Prosthecochloris aestuarii (strain DSM 271 / SK 413) TaxID=290512 RepID=B4S9Q0_PROA2|nr:RNA-directed DNA polymerase [Prosthecochloris aestuarii]ACF47377.1 RNA-directed DNA polymerase (Reverse transcriptase) [Prosthecochloris aestuarii DSM 271]